MSTIDDVHAFGRMLLAGGRLPDGSKLLSRASVEAMTTDQIGVGPGVAGPSPDGAQGWGFGVGVQVRRTSLGPSVGGYGWAGGLGSSWAQRSGGGASIGVVLTTDMFTSAVPAAGRDPGLLDRSVRGHRLTPLGCVTGRSNANAIGSSISIASMSPLSISPGARSASKAIASRVHQGRDADDLGERLPVTPLLLERDQKRQHDHCRHVHHPDRQQGEHHAPAAPDAHEAMMGAGAEMSCASRVCGVVQEVRDRAAAVPQAPSLHRRQLVDAAHDEGADGDGVGGAGPVVRQPAEQPRQP